MDAAISDIVTYLLGNGPFGVMLGIVMYDNFKMKTKLFEVIENNTAALTKLTEAHKRRRERYVERD